MFGFIAKRCFHVSQTSLTSTKGSVLAKLRKSTGYSVANCKKALEKFSGDLVKAEEWLHAEAKSNGWAKWAKVQNRTAAQGLIGVCSQNNVGVMLEINCETDFVARNAEFQEYVTKMISGCIDFASNLNAESEINKEVLEESQLSAVKCDSSTLGELLVAATSKFNERTVAKRAVCLKVNNEILLSSFAHPAVPCPDLSKASLGKYGVLLALKKSKDAENVNADSVGLNICQHIIGMSPSSIGQLTEKDVAKFTSSEKPGEDLSTEEKEEPAKEEPATGEEKTEETEMEEQEPIDSTLKDSDEARLLFQPFLLQPEVTVGATLYKSGLEVVTFERFECGEQSEEAAVAQSATG